MFLQLLFQSPILFILVFGALVVSLTIHEFAHAYIAHKLGDDTAKYLGRLTLNPLAHLDVFGTLLLVFAGFGWGKPVPVNPYNFANPRRDSALVSLAGPAVNFLLAIFLAILYNYLSFIPLLNIFLYMTITYNIILGTFNLIPINPLDGFKIVNGLLNERQSHQWLQTGQYGMYILLILVFTRSLNVILDPVLNFWLNLLNVTSPIF